MFPDARRSATVVALEPVETLTLGQREFVARNRFATGRRAGGSATAGTSNNRSPDPDDSIPGVFPAAPLRGGY